MDENSIIVIINWLEFEGFEASPMRAGELGGIGRIVTSQRMPEDSIERIFIRFVRLSQIHGLTFTGEFQSSA